MGRVRKMIMFPYEEEKEEEYPLMIFPFPPVPKPRMTQSDRWKVGDKKRKAVKNYHDFRDRFRKTMERNDWIVDANMLIRIKMYIPMAKSWSKKVKKAMEGMPHKQKPDIDNLEKGILDALYEDDSRVWDLHATKYWTNSEGSFTIQNIEE